MAKDIDTFLRDNMKFLKIENGETVTLVYKGYSVVPDKFNDGKEVISYLFSFPNSDKTISWNKGSMVVAREMRKIPVGETIQIKRTGEGPKTTYDITVI